MVLVSANQVPARHRNHNGYLLRWGCRSVPFDPGEGTQRQVVLAGAPAMSVHHACVTHCHGDHCLSLLVVLQRLTLDRVVHPVEILFPASGKVYFDRPRDAGKLEAGGARATLADVAEVRPGQRMAFVKDAGMCDTAIELAAGADLVVCEATVASADAHPTRGSGPGRLRAG